MPDCSVSFSFSKRGTTVQPGEELQGEVVVKVDAPCRCEGLTLAAEWRTHGKGNLASGQAEVLTLFKGEWEAGEHRYRFTYKAPVGPFTYAGQLLNIGWFLHARADIPWAIDPKADSPFVLVPGPSSSADPYFFGPLYKPSPESWGVSETAAGGSAVKPPTSVGHKVAVGVVIALFVIVLAAALPILAAVVAPILIFFAVKHAMVKNKLGEPEVRITPNTVRPGDELVFLARVTPQKQVRLGKVFAELVGEERVVSGSGKHAHTHRHSLCAFTHLFPVEQREVRGGEAVELRANLKLPPGAPVTFAATSNTVEWRVRLSVELLGWPDWEKTYPITVRPGPVEAPLVTYARRD